MDDGLALFDAPFFMMIRWLRKTLRTAARKPFQDNFNDGSGIITISLVSRLRIHAAPSVAQPANVANSSAKPKEDVKVIEPTRDVSQLMVQKFTRLGLTFLKMLISKILRNADYDVNEIIIEILTTTLTEDYNDNYDEALEMDENDLMASVENRLRKLSTTPTVDHVDKFNPNRPSTSSANQNTNNANPAKPLENRKRSTDDELESYLDSDLIDLIDNLYTANNTTPRDARRITNFFDSCKQYLDVIGIRTKTRPGPRPKAPQKRRRYLNDTRNNFLRIKRFKPLESKIKKRKNFKPVKNESPTTEMMFVRGRLGKIVMKLYAEKQE